MLKWCKRRVHPLLKEILDPPLSRMVDTCTLIWNSDACLYISHCNIKKRKIIPLFICNGVLRKLNFQFAWQAFYREEGRRSAKGALGEKPSLHNDKKVWVKVCRNQGGPMERLKLEFCSLTNLVVLSHPSPPPPKPLDGMLVHPGLPQRYVASTHLCTLPCNKACQAQERWGGGGGEGGEEKEQESLSFPPWSPLPFSLEACHANWYPGSSCVG